MNLSLADLEFRTASDDWGTGKGANLLPEEVDRNFFTLAHEIMEMQASPLQPHQIETITVTDNQMTITLSDGVTTFGPYNLPVSVPTYDDAGWQADHNYKFGTLFTGAAGLYMVVRAHTSNDTFNPDDGDVQGKFYKLLVPGVSNAFEISAYVPGILGEDLDQFAHIFAFMTTKTFTIDNADSCIAKLDSAFDDDSFVRLLKNDEEIGSISFTGGSVTGTVEFDLPVQFNPGDQFIIQGPPNVDDNAKGLNALIVGRLGVLTDEEASEIANDNED